MYTLKVILLGLLCALPLSVSAANTTLAAPTTPPGTATHPPGGTLRNELAGSSSPYLAMHAHDPVHWQHWGPRAFAIARRENKLLYVSSGYFACHWCHVMQRQNFLNPSIAALINKYFIPVIIDRELNPALDARLINFVEHTRGQAGWPLNVFITPEGYPLIGVVYLPPAQFKPLLSRLGERWAGGGPALKQLAKSVTAELTRQAASTTSNHSPAVVPIGPVEVAQRTQALQQAFLKRSFVLADEFEGGFGAQNKFPMVPQLDALLTLYQRDHDARVGKFLRLTLDHMASGGLHDQLGGGFFRYTIDPGWQTPHFEKMLYENALLARLYLRAGKIFAHPGYTGVGEQTLNFILATFGTGAQGMGASLSAVDSKGVDGGYYLWQKATLRRLLNPDTFRVAEQAWGLDAPPALEAGYILDTVRNTAQVATRLSWSRQRVRTLLTQARATLLAARAHRHAPRDDKRLAAWNALTLSALVTGARDGTTLATRTRYRAAAQRLRNFIVHRLWNGRQLKRAFDLARPHRGLGDASLEDYAYVAAALYDWGVFSGQNTNLALARTIAHHAWQEFHGAQGWRLDTSTLFHYDQGQAVIADGPMPSPSAVLCRTSLALGRRLGDRTLIDEARTALLTHLNRIEAEPFWHATRIEAMHSLLTPDHGVAPKTGTAHPQ